MYKLLARGSLLFAVLTLLLSAFSEMLVWAVPSWTEIVNISTVAMSSIVCASIVAAIVCVQWLASRNPNHLTDPGLQPKIPLIVRALSIITMVFGALFFILFVATINNTESGANIGLGFLGIAVQLFGSLNALAVLLSSIRIQRPQLP